MRTTSDNTYIVILTEYDDMGEITKKYFTFPNYSKAKIAVEDLFNLIQEKIGGDEEIEFDKSRASTYNPYHWKDEEEEFELEIVKSDDLEYGLD